MDFSPFLNVVASVNNVWSFTAYAITAILVVANLSFIRQRKGGTSSVVWAFAVIICVLGLVPTLANAYLRHLDSLSVYRVRTLVLDPEHVPVSGATLRTTASNETTQTSQGIGIVSVYRGTMPSDGKVTIYADFESAFLHGRTDVQLGADPNPSVTIDLKANNNAMISGLVEDKGGLAVPGARVTVLAGESTLTAPDGTFTVKTAAAIGQQVRLHVEKVGYNAVDQDHPAGRDPVTIVLTKIKRH